MRRGRPSLGDVRVDGFTELAYRGDAYEITTRISRQDADNVGFQLRRSADGSRHADAGLTRDYAYLNRAQTGRPDSWKVESRTPVDGTDTVELRILVDRTTIEVFVGDGRYTHSSQVFAPAGDGACPLLHPGGAAVFRDLRITEFADLAQRPARLLADFEGNAWGAGVDGHRVARRDRPDDERPSAAGRRAGRRGPVSPTRSPGRTPRRGSSPRRRSRSTGTRCTS